MSNNPLFSVVLPSYGVEKYLEKAVDSILSQSFSDFEIIIVDDASPDSVGKTADRLAKENACIRVIHHEKNLGLSEARNSGLRVATGSYVFFMDPDDVIEPTLLEEVKASLDIQQSQVVMFALTEDYLDADGVLRNRVTVKHSDNTLFLDSEEKIRSQVIYLEKNTMLGYAWNKIYSREYLQKIGATFETVEFIEDIAFNVEVFRHLSSLTVLSSPLYHYIKRVNKGLTSKYSENFYPVHKRRVEMLFEEHREWDMCSKEVTDILAGEYARFIFSAVQRSFSKQADINGRQRREFILSIFDDELYKTLIPPAETENKAVKLMLFILKRRSVFLLSLSCRILNFTKSFSPAFFSKIKQNR